MLRGLRLARYRFSLICTSEVQLRPFPGAVVRGALGHALHAVDRRAYDELYDAASAGSGSGGDEVPRPYVLAPRRPQKKHYRRGARRRQGALLPLARACLQIGEVAWFGAEKGYGFIEPDNGGDDVFVHRTNVEGLGYGEGMSGGEPLEYDVEQTDKGLSALNVTRLDS